MAAPSGLYNLYWEVRQAGSDTNGGGFIPGSSGTDMSIYVNKNASGGTLCQSTTANLSTTDVVADGTAVITSAAAAFSAAIVGNIIYIAGNWYQAVSWASGTPTKLTLDRVVTIASSLTMNIGGALASIGQASALISAAGNVVFVRNDGVNFTITSVTANVPGGVSFPGAQFNFQGYSTNRTLGNADTGPVIQHSITGATLFNSAGNGMIVANIICDGKGSGAGTGGALAFSKLSGNNGAYFDRCTFKGYNNASGYGNQYVGCFATLNSAAVFAGLMNLCEADLNTATPFNGNCFDCISSNTTGAGFTLGSFAVNCVAYKNSGDGFSGTAGSILKSCHSEANTGFGYKFQNGGKTMQACSHYSNTGGGVSATGNGALQQVGTIAVTAGTVFNGAASGDFSLNSVVNQGSLLRAAGAFTSFPRGLTATYRDIGAAQHQDSGGAAVTRTYAI